jgi:nicotinic acid mononucleotide adenylyltransferase
MFRSFQLIVCDRDGAFRLPDDPRLEPYRDRIHRCLLPASYQHVSSTEVRQRCQPGLDIAHLVPPAVARYIHEHELYRDASTSAHEEVE